MWYSTEARIAPGCSGMGRPLMVGKLCAAVLILACAMLTVPAAAQSPPHDGALYDRSAYGAAREELSKGDVPGAVETFCRMFRPAAKGDLWTLSVMLLCHPENIPRQVDSLSPVHPVFVQEVEFNGLRCYRICAGLARRRSGLNALARKLRERRPESRPFPVKVLRSCAPTPLESVTASPSGEDRNRPAHHPAYLGPPVREPSRSPSTGTGRGAGKATEPVPGTPKAPGSREGEVLFQEGLRAYHAGRLEEAERYYRRSLEADPGRAEVINNLGVLYLKKGDCARARSLFEKALKQTPDYASAHLNLAGALWGLGKKDDALQEAREAVVLDPRSVNGYLTLASFNLSLGNKAAAGDAARKALLLEPENEQARIFLSASEKKNGD